MNLILWKFTWKLAWLGFIPGFGHFHCGWSITSHLKVYILPGHLYSWQIKQCCIHHNGMGSEGKQEFCKTLSIAKAWTLAKLLPKARMPSSDRICSKFATYEKVWGHSIGMGSSKNLDLESPHICHLAELGLWGIWIWKFEHKQAKTSNYKLQGIIIKYSYSNLNRNSVFHTINQGWWRGP